MNFFDILFPPHCISCQKLTDNSTDFYKYLCPGCLKKIKLNHDNFCPVCHNLTRFGATCMNCKKKTPLTGLIVAANYDNPILKEAIHYFKYRYLKELSLPLSWLLMEKLKDFPFRDKNEWVLLPVPLAKKRLKNRGFNQAELLTENLSKWLGISQSSAIIERTKFRLPQMEIKSYQQRKRNVKNSFRIKKEAHLEKIKGHKIMLVDDVATTGATLSECAKILKPYVKEVWGCVVAK